MTNLPISRRGLFAILVGFLVIVSIGIISSIVSFLMTLHLIRNFAVQDFPAAFYKQPYLTVSWVLRTISYISPIFAGVVVGWIVKEKGWLYGGVLGVILKLTSIGIVLLTFLLPSSVIYGPNIPQNYGYNLAQKNMLNKLLYAPITITLTALGGWLGEKYSEKRKHLKTRS